MATGLGIRDFTKVYRELRYKNEGSIRLSEIEHNAYLNRLTIEVTDYDASRSINYKTNPENTHWGYCTALKGSSVISSIPVKFVKHRVFDLINEGIWNYHQNSENFGLNNAANVAIANEIIAQLLDESIPFPGIQTLLELIEEFEDGAPSLVKWLFSIEDSDDPSGPQESADYTAFPIASPYPDVFKFKSDIPVSFLFRLESWYLVNPSFYIVSNPTDTGDATEGEDEYPSPNEGDGDGDGNEFPAPSLPSGENDPKDYGPLPEDDNVLLRVRYTVVAWQAGCVPFQGPGFVNVPWEGSYNYSLKYISEKENGCSPGITKLGLVLVTPSGGEIEITNVATEMREGSRIDSYEIV